MALADEIAVKLGLNTTQFRSALKDANADITAFKQAGTFGENEGLGATVRSIHHEMRTLHAFITGGGIITAARELFVKGAEYAKNYSGAIDENVEAMKRLEIASKGASDVIGQAVVVTAGFMEKVGIEVGALVYGEDAAADALYKMGQAADAAFDAEKLKKYTDAMDKLDKQRRDNAYSEMTDHQKINLLLLEKEQLEEKQAAFDAKDAEYVKLQGEIEQKNFAIRKIDQKDGAENEKKIYDLVFGRVEDLEPKEIKNSAVITDNKKEQAKTEKEITDEKIKQATIEKNSQASIVGIRGGNQFNDASDSALAEVARRNRAQAQLIQGGSEGYGIGQNLEVARLLAEAMNAEKELAFRRNLQNTIQFQGVDAARRSFAGDPLLFDRVLQQFTTQQDKSTTLLQSLDDRLQTAGFGRR